MIIDKLLSNLEEYLNLGKESGSDSELIALRHKISRALDEYIHVRFAALRQEERRKEMMSTQRVRVPVGGVKVSWEEVVHLLDALNAPPLPLSFHPPKDETAVREWMSVYSNWYYHKRTKALRNLLPDNIDDVEIEIGEE